MKKSKKAGLVSFLGLVAAMAVLSFDGPVRSWASDWWANAGWPNEKRTVLADLTYLEKAGIQPWRKSEAIGVGLARVTFDQERLLSAAAHAAGRCGGYELIPEKELASLALQPGGEADILTQLEEQVLRDQTAARMHGFGVSQLELEQKPEIVTALAQVSASEIKNTVEWFSRQRTRYHNSEEGQAFVLALKERIEEMVRSAPYPVEVAMIEHESTPQSSLRVRVPGRVRPQEIVAMGGHMDSININFGFPGGKAPGADDNASGSANLIEALRTLLAQPQPERSVEFFWYAGEEAGLLGSAEIAKKYKAQKQDVVGVLQLDMTLHPGSGPFVLSSMTDYTSPWLRGYFAELNRLYIGAKIIDGRCGYACSDHASWYRQGFPSLMPFESTFDSMNDEIHTPRDVINERSNFDHSAMFARIAVAFALDLGNSELRQPR